MRTLLLSILASLCSCITATAHKQVIFHFDTTSVSSIQSPFRAVKVVELRENHPQIFIQGGRGLGKEDVLTERTFSDEITAFGNRLLSRKDSGNDTLLVLLYRQTISLGKENGIVGLRMVVSFFEGGDNSYKYLYTADSFYEAYDRKPHNMWSSMLNTAWYNNFAMAAKLGGQNPSGKSYSLAAAVNRPQTLKLDLPVYNTTHYPTGIYFTREEFLNLKPGLSAFIEEGNGDENPYPHIYYQKLEGGKRGPRIEGQSYYAVYNGKRWYKAGLYGLYQMHFIAGDFYFNAPITGLKGKETEQPQIGLVGGLLAAGINSLVNESRVANNKHNITIKSVRLDAETGRYILDYPPARN